MGLLLASPCSLLCFAEVILSIHTDYTDVMPEGLSKAVKRQPRCQPIDTQLTSELLSADFTQAFCSGGPQSIVVLDLAGMAYNHCC